MCTGLLVRLARRFGARLRGLRGAVIGSSFVDVCVKGLSSETIGVLPGRELVVGSLSYADIAEMHICIHQFSYLIRRLVDGESASALPNHRILRIHT